MTPVKAVKRLYGGCRLYMEDVPVGYITAGGSERKFGLFLRGVYWTGSGHNRKGGASGHTFKRMKDAIQAAETILNEKPQ